MKKLEDFVQMNRDDFDDRLPSFELWGKIEDELYQKPKKKFKLWQKAASIAAVVVIAFMSGYYVQLEKNNYLGIAKISDPEIKGLLETEAFYATQVSNKLNEIENCYDDYPELRSEIEQTLRELDVLYRQLREDLKDDMMNKQVIEAMIQNNRIRLKMVNRVSKRVEC